MKKKQIVLYVIFMLILLTTSVYATISAELDFRIVTNNGNKFYAGDEFTMTIGLKNVDASQGIKSIEGYIDIDENIFEALSSNSIVTNENGKVEIGSNNDLSVYDANNMPSNIDKGIIFNNNPVSEKGDYKIVINLDNPIVSATDLVTLKFKIKENVVAGNYQSVMTYKLFNVFSTDAGEKLELAQQTYRIEISDKTQENNNVANNTVNNIVNNDENQTVNNTISNNTENQPTNNAISNNAVSNGNNTNQVANNIVNKISNNSSNNATNSSKSGNLNTANNVKNYTTSSNGTLNKQKADNTISPTKLPKTGFRIVLIPIIVIAIIGLVFYKKYSKYNNYHE